MKAIVHDNSFILPLCNWRVWWSGEGEGDTPPKVERRRRGRYPPRWSGEGEGDPPPGGAGKERGIPPPLPPCFSVKGFAEHTVLIKP